MGVVERKTRLFEDIVRLQRAADAAPSVREISEVRASLEEQLGRTVPVSLAARWLGVSSEALRRWVKREELPLVLSETGHHQLPLGLVLELRRRVDEARSEGRKHVLEPMIVDGQHRAEALAKVLARNAEAPEKDPHGRAQRRSLAYHRALARQLTRADVRRAQQRLVIWRRQERIDPRYADRWEALLSKPLPAIKAAITREDDDAKDLRQNSPFAGALSEPERRAILKAIR